MNIAVRNTQNIYCCSCGFVVRARLTSGREIYPHRPDLFGLPFWRCEGCSNYVGCHHKTNQPTRPLGVIPTPELTAARRRIHAILDPLWQTQKVSRRRLYTELSDVLGRQYHTAELRSMQEVNLVMSALQRIQMRCELGSMAV